jgi:hypothetical protein
LTAVARRSGQKKKIKARPCIDLRGGAALAAQSLPVASNDFLRGDPLRSSEVKHHDDNATDDRGWTYDDQEVAPLRHSAYYSHPINCGGS